MQLFRSPSVGGFTGRPLPWLAIAVAASLVFGSRVADVAAAKGSSFPDPVVDNPVASGSLPESIVLAGGCFWGVQAVFQHLRGVVSATSGYAGGSAKNAKYELVSTGNTGHAESVRVTYDPALVSLGQVLKVFFDVAHDPTELNRQGPDEGPQYRSAIFYTGDNQRRIADACLSARRGQGLPPANRDADRAARGLLCRRGLPSGLRDQASLRAVHHDERPPEGRRPA
jgi:peptide-methionine (S)-S-oxide reductase